MDYLKNHICRRGARPCAPTACVLSYLSTAIQPVGSEPIYTQPIYTRFWNGFKQFPKGLHAGSSAPPTVSSPAAAALISGGLGAVAMMATHHFAELSKPNNQIVIQMGSWIPGAMNRDPMWGNLENYAGKEMMFFIGWWVSWPVLHQVLKHRQVKPRTLLVWLFGLFTLATAMAWHPLFPWLSLM